MQSVLYPGIPFVDIVGYLKMHGGRVQDQRPDGTVWMVVAITAEMARDLLCLNTKNRQHNAAHSNYLRQQMDTGNWRFTADPIKFSNTSVLIDGQHRLVAVSDSNKSVTFSVVIGLPNEAFDAIDQNKVRSAADIAYVHGEANTSKLISAIQLLYMLQSSPDGSGLNSRFRRMSPIDCMAYLSHHPKLRESITFACTNCCVGMLPRVAAVCHYLFAKQNEELADEFFLRLKDGAGLETGSPILALRNRLAAVRAAGKRSESNVKYQIAITCKAWNAWRANQHVNMIRFDAERESFPSVA